LREKIKVGKKTYQAKKFIISTGGKPRIPNISKNTKLINTSDDIFSLKKLPKRMVIEGGGYIAIEFAFIFANLGVKVDLVYRGKQILKSFDSEIVDFLIQSTPKGKIKYHLESQIEKVDKSKNDLIINLTNKKKISSDYILSAIGRVANTENLGLENTSVQLNENKSIKVNRHFQTNDSNIYAVGDVIDYVNLTPVAIRQGHFLADKLFNNKKTIEYDFANIPTANFKSMKKTFSKTNKDTFYKLVIDKKDKTILGIHIISDDAAELIQILAVNVVAGNSLDEFRKTVAVHPTSSEEIITI